jgi:hypothetical protein
MLKEKEERGKLKGKLELRLNKCKRDKNEGKLTRNISVQHEGIFSDEEKDGEMCFPSRYIFIPFNIFFIQAKSCFI